MSPYVETVVLPFLRKLGRGTILKTGMVAELLDYSRRRMCDFFLELERAGLLVRKPHGRVWRLA